jgi:hypothetical protein
MNLRITAKTNGVAIELDETYTVTSWMRQKSCNAEKFNLSPTIEDGIIHIDRATDDLTAPTYEFDIRISVDDVPVFTGIIEVNLSNTITPTP